MPPKTSRVSTITNSPLIDDSIPARIGRDHRKFLIPLTLAAILVVAALAGCSSKETSALLQPAEALGTVVAEEAVRLAGQNKQIAVISPDANWGPMSLAEKTFRDVLKKQGYTLSTTKSANLGDPMRSGEIGLKPSDYFEVLETARDAGAIVSFAGAPLLKNETGNVPAAHAPVIVVATAMLGAVPGVPGNQLQLARLLDARAIQLAVIDGAAPAGSDPDPKASAERKIFSENFRTLKAL